MPTIFIAYGLRFFFYADDHEPIHIHVARGDDHAKIELEPQLRLVYNKGLKAGDLRRAIELVSERSEEIAKAWHQYH